MDADSERSEIPKEQCKGKERGSSEAEVSQCQAQGEGERRRDREGEGGRGGVIMDGCVN